MQSFSTSLFLVLCTITSLTDAQHYHHGHGRPSGWPTGTSGALGRHHPHKFPFAPGSSGSPFASASGAYPNPPSPSPATAPYPIGNGTTAAGTGTGTGGPTGTITRSITQYITIDESPLSTALASVPIGGESPVSTGAVEAPGSTAPASPEESAPRSVSSSLIVSPSGILGGAGESTCPVPITVTVTQDTTVTVTEPASPSLTSIESVAPVESQPSEPSAAASSSAALAPVESQSPLPSAAASTNAALAATTDTLDLTSATISSNVPVQAATTQASVQEMSDGQVVDPASTNAPVEVELDAVPATSSPTSSITYSSVPFVAYGADNVSGSQSEEATSTAQTSSSTLPAVDTYIAATSTVASVLSPASSGSTSTSSSSLTPNNIKAGISGYRSITEVADWDLFTPYIGWYSDYFPDTPASGQVAGIPMLWGNGHLGDQGDDDDAARLQLFQNLYNDTSSAYPEYMYGFYEPDWTPPDSSNIDVATAAANWTTLLQRLQPLGTKLGSPSMAKQLDEDGWLETFGKDAGLIGTDGVPTWDYTVIHTNKPNVSGVIEDINYYLTKYKKPIWVGEFTCIYDEIWDTCSDPTQIQNFIEQSVDYFQNNESVVAYGFNNGHGLNETWYMFNNVTGKITTPGQIYLDKIKTYV